MSFSFWCWYRTECAVTLNTLRSGASHCPAHPFLPLKIVFDSFISFFFLESYYLIKFWNVSCHYLNAPGTFGDVWRHFLVGTVLGGGGRCGWYLVGRVQGCSKHPAVHKSPLNSCLALSVNSAAVEKPCSRGARSDYPTLELRSNETEVQRDALVLPRGAQCSNSLKHQNDCLKPNTERRLLSFWLWWETPFENSVPLLGERCGGGWVGTKTRFGRVFCRGL